MIALSDDPPTPLRQPLSADKRVAWAEPIPLDEVKAIGRAYGCTVNDVLLAAASGAIRRLLFDLGEDPAGLVIRATVPVNLRPLEHAKSSATTSAWSSSSFPSASPIRSHAWSGWPLACAN